MDQEPRRELKMVTAGMAPAQVRHIIRTHHAAFRPIHHPRRINNVYLDTHAFQHYYENIDGLPRRTKPRIRWYGETQNTEDARPVLEFKIKNNLWGTKQRFDLPGLNPWQLLDHPRTATLFTKADLPAHKALRLANHVPMLGNTYLREYYLSFDGRFRLTLDREVAYFETHRQTHRRGQPWLRDPLDRLVIEIKCARKDEPGLAAISGALPFRVTRNSKYVNGIRKIHSPFQHSTC